MPAGELRPIGGARRVVVTGIGAVTPLGATAADLWRGLLEGRPAAAPITRFDACGFRARIAAEVPDRLVTDRMLARKRDRFAGFAVMAAREAWADAGIRIDALNPYDVGVLIGTSHAGEESALASAQLLFGATGGRSISSMERNTSCPSPST